MLTPLFDISFSQCSTLSGSFCVNGEVALVSNCSHNSTQVLKVLRVLIGHLNVTSLVKHVDELRIYMEDKPFEILSINESRLGDTVNLNTVHVDVQVYEKFSENRNRERGWCCTLLSRQSYGGSIQDG